MKKVLKIVGIIFVVIIVMGIVLLFSTSKSLSEQKAVTINPIDISKVSDGSYEGEYKFSRWESKVCVEIKDGAVVKVTPEGAPLFPDVAGELSEKIIEEQKVDVDVVSGATATSKAYLKAVENALQ